VEYENWRTKVMDFVETVSTLVPTEGSTSTLMEVKNSKEGPRWEICATGRKREFLSGSAPTQLHRVPGTWELVLGLQEVSSLSI
jgi:hypothetical protein